MDIEKLHSAIAAMGDALESNAASPGGPAPSGPPLQPGMLLWESGIYYMCDSFTNESTKPYIFCW